ncbi:MAG: 4Fe-4S binding protein [Candidatus Omnitrophica bacterium]|nr:4Fe-4S binding protein [Candidatus Omnitrophota bacterium]
MYTKLRIIIAAICFALITFLFLDFTGVVHTWFGWLAKMQFFPAVIASNIMIGGIIVCLTLLFGRVYCSTLCPLGVFQDMISWIAGKKTKNRFSYTSSINPLRYSILVVFVVAIAMGSSLLIALLEPYSAYGRIVSSLFAPIYMWGNNVLAYFAERMNSYAFYSVDVWMKSSITFIIAFLTFTVLVVLAWKKGRLYCNTICPLGTVLGVLSKYSLFKFHINEGECTHCGLCEKNCKASCINAGAGTIDHSRCVSCFNCIDTCPQGGLQYKIFRTKKNSVETVKEELDEKRSARRKFLTISAIFGIAFARKAYAKDFDGGLAILKAKKKPERLTPIVPPGSLSIKNLRKHCTACQLCISVCPNNILYPSSDMASLMQPFMSYERGYCRPECTKCSEVCPTGAIHKISSADKSAIQIGHAVWKKDLCIVNRDKVSCDNCARHCPTGAILMAPQSSADPLSLKIPMIDESRCIGCGACENLCPARPYSAIYVEGHERHKTV